MSTKKASTETTAAEKQETKETETIAATAKEAAKTAETVKEAQYTHQQLIDGCKAFETSRAIVATALRGTKQELLTEQEAKKLIDNFKNKKR